MGHYQSDEIDNELIAAEPNMQYGGLMDSTPEKGH